AITGGANVENTGKYRFSLRIKLVIFTTILAIITYSTSAFFIYILYDYVKMFWNIHETVFVIITLLLGIIWSGILAFIAAAIITRPLQRLEGAASEAAQGNLNQEIYISRSDDEIRALSIAFDTMLKNIKDMVVNIDGNFSTTNETVALMKDMSATATTHSQSISSVTEDIAKGAISSAESMQEMVESVEEATKLATEVQTKAEQSSTKSTAMLHMLTESKDVILRLVQGIQHLASE